MALTRPRYSQIYDTDYKLSVRVATTGDVGNLVAGGTQTNSIDGITLAANDRVLVKDQSTGAQNGIYRVATVGTGSDGTWVRALDADASDKVTFGMQTTVGEGNLNSGRVYRLTTSDPVVLGTTSLTFSTTLATVAGSNTQIQYNKAGILSASANLTFADNNNTLSISSNASVNAYAVDITGNAVPDSSISAQQQISSSKAYNQSPVAGINFATKYNSAGGGAGLGGITVSKSNATDGDLTSHLALHTRPAGAGGITERLRIDGNGNVVISATTTSTTVNTGALVVAGGVGIQGSVQGVAATFTGAVTLGSGSSNVVISATTSTTSVSTGALLVAGGTGIAGNAFVGGNLTIGGNLTVNGTTVTINANNLSVNDSLLYLAEENPADILDIGITAHIQNPTLNHVGFVRDATDSTWKLFSNVITQPSNTVDFTGAIYSSLQIGNLTVVSNSSGNGYGRYGGFFDESTLLQGVWIGNAGSGTATPRIGFFNGNTTQNWQIDNSAGSFRWFTPGVVRMSLDTNGNLAVPSSITVGNVQAVTIGNINTQINGSTARISGPLFANSVVSLGTGSTTTNVVISATTTASSNVTGALIVSGGVGVQGAIYDRAGGDVRSAPQVPANTSYILLQTDNGKHVYLTSPSTGASVNASVFNVGDMVMIVNAVGSSITITQGASVTLRLAGTATTGSRTLANNGVATLLCTVGGATPTFYCSGAGLS
jgi:hypothetical protein